MSRLNKKNYMRYFWWLTKPLYSFIKSKMTIDNIKSHLDLDPSKPVLYVLPKRSIADLLVLFYHCRKLGLPLPTLKLEHLSMSEGASFLYLSKPGLFMTRAQAKPMLPLVKQIKSIENVDDAEIQVVPVSILWGKNPGREESSFFRLLFNDNENAGVIQKFFIVLAQGRNTIVHMGKPISLRRLVREKAPTDQTAKKLRRVLRVHFRTQRNTILGQKMYIREQVIDRILASSVVRSAIQEEAAKNKSNYKKSFSLAKNYAREICADQSYRVVRSLEFFLSKLWNKLFDGVQIRGIDQVREYADKGYEIVYVPCHRSHMDYLLINYSIYASGLPSPHTAAGVNLNFWPVGGLLRRGGAFFMKRSFAGNRLYSSIFSEYLQYLLSSGYPVAFFPEGGRSRTGRLLPLKTGLISMVIQSYVKNPDRRIVFFPVYVGYDKVVEVGSYLKELSGKSKRSESLISLFKSLNILRKYWGKAYIGVGESIELKGFLDTHHSSWRDSEFEQRPEWLGSISKKLGNKIGVNINKAVTVSASSLVSLGILSSQYRAMPEDELEGLIGCLIGLAKGLGYGDRIPQDSPKDMIENAIRLDAIRRYQHPGGDVLYFNELDSIVNTYYKNNILHVFVLPSLIASLFRRRSAIDEPDLMDGCLVIYPFLKEELFLPWEEVEVEDMLGKALDEMLLMGLLKRDGAKIIRPESASIELAYFHHIGRFLGLLIERYAIVAALLAKVDDKDVIEPSHFESQCQKMALRLAVLNGITNPDAGDRKLFHSHINQLKKMGYLKTVEGGDTFEVDPKVKVVFEKTKLLLSSDTQYSIERLSIKKS